MEDELTCRRLWGFDCNLVLSKHNSFICPEEDHYSEDLFKIVDKSVKDGFDPFLIGSVLSGEKRLEPNHDFIRFLSMIPEGRRYAASSVNVPTYSVEQVSTISSSYRLTEIASAPNTPADALDYLSTQSSLSIKLAVARNSSTAEHTLRRMYREGPFEIFLALAENISTPVDILLDLAKKHRNAVGKNLAQNQAINMEIRSLLIKSEDVYARIFMASSELCPEETQILLAKDEDWRVRYALGRSKGVTETILKELFQDEKDAVRSAVAYSPYTPSDLLEQLSQEEPYVIRYRLAQNQNLPLHLFTPLLEDKEVAVRKILATNPYTPLFYDEADMRHVIEQSPEYGWVCLLSANEAPEIIKSEIRGLASRQGKAAINDFVSPDRKNLFLIADLVADGRLAMSAESHYSLIYQLCQYPKDSDRLEEFAFFVLQENGYSQESRIRVRNIIVSNMRDAGTRVQAILRHTAGY